MRTSLILAIALLTNLYAATSTPRTQIAQKADDAPSEPGRQMDVTGMNLYMHDYSPTGGERRKPTLWMRAEKGHATEDEEVWQVEGVHAVVYGDEETDKSDLVIEADLGLFNRRENFARLYGNVLIDTGNMTLQLKEIEWDNLNKLAHSNSPVVLRQSNSKLKADALTLDPNSGAFILKNVSGPIQLQAPDP